MRCEQYLNELVDFLLKKLVRYLIFEGFKEEVFWNLIMIGIRPTKDYLVVFSFHSVHSTCAIMRY